METGPCQLSPCELTRYAAAAHGHVDSLPPAAVAALPPIVLVGVGPAAGVGLGAAGAFFVSEAVRAPESASAPNVTLVPAAMLDDSGRAVPGLVLAGTL